MESCYVYARLLIDSLKAFLLDNMGYIPSYLLLGLNIYKLLFIYGAPWLFKIPLAMNYMCVQF